MKKILLLALVLSGCVTTNVKRIYIPANTYVSPIAVNSAPTVVIYEEGFPFPTAESSYIWDPIALKFYFIDGKSRHYMHRGWTFKHPQ